MTCRSRVTGLAVLVAAALLAVDGRAEERTSTVSVTGSGSVSAAPDQATVSAGVVAEASRAADAVRQANAAMQKVLTALDAAGIDRKLVQTSRFDVSPVYSDSASARGRSEITGYRASNQVQVEVRSIEKVGAVLDALVAAGANEVGGVSFGIADPKPLADEARKQAVADARRKAELYAQATGATLGRVLSVEEGGGGGPVPVYARAAPVAAAPIAPGQLDVTAGVTITWSLAP